VQVLFDPKELTFKNLIRHYLTEFKPQRYSTESTSQYRAAIFYQDEQQKREAADVLSSLGYSQEAAKSLLEPAKVFYAAEQYHQNYYGKFTAGAGNK
jgi:peptide methionine sulfoxide reductase msrA/msrB